MLTLHFQFHKGIAAHHRRDVFDGLCRAGARRVRPLFPGQEDEELADLFVVEFDEPTSGQDLMHWLNDRKEVAFVEQPPGRKLLARDSAPE